MTMSSSLQRGASMPIVLTITALTVFMLAFAGLSIWAYINYVDQRDNVNAKIDTAVATAEKKQGDDLEAEFAEREKEPLKTFRGASDYGSLSFRYPKTWSVFVAQDGTDDSGFTAYLNPAVVPPIETESSRFAVRVEITNEQYDQAIQEFNDLVEEGKLKTTSVKANSDRSTGTRLDGSFDENIRGAAVIFRIRDKTAIVRTDADTFKPDFDKLVQTITFEE